MVIDECFKILELPVDATEEQIKQAYRDQVFVWHPDRIGSGNPRLTRKAEEKIKQINEAKDLLMSLLSLKKKNRNGENVSEPSGEKNSRKNSREIFVPKQRLRNLPAEISAAQFITQRLFKLYKWHRWENRPDEIFWNNWFTVTNELFSSMKETICDRATGLMWQQSGSEMQLIWPEAYRYVVGLNQDRFCGFGDWRIPTVEELSSLHEEGEYIHLDDLRGYYIGPYFSSKFNEKQNVCWSCDTRAAGQELCPAEDIGQNTVYVRLQIPQDSVWVYNYSDDQISTPKGIIGAVEKSRKLWVRAVRSMTTAFG